MNMKEPRDFRPARDDRGRRARFSIALPVKLLMQAVMVGSIAFAITQFVPAVVAIAVALAATGCFSHLVHTALDAALAVRTRVLSGIAAGLIGVMTSALAYGSFYASLFAEQSALTYFEEKRTAVMADLNAQLASADAAHKALKAWADDSAAKAKQEEEVGNSCRGNSDKKFGPITRWRRSEAVMAGSLAMEFESRLKSARAAVDPVRDVLPETFAQALSSGAAVNKGIDALETLAHGSFAVATLGTLERQQQSRILPATGAPFECGDAARDDFIARAVQAVADLRAKPAMQPLKPAIDLRSRKEVMVRGLLRGANLALGLVTFGRAGSFADDPLMARALRTATFNRETLPYAIVLLVELSIVLCAIWARASGDVPFPFVPEHWDARARASAAVTRTARSRALLALWHGIVRGVLNLFYGVERAAEDTITLPQPWTGETPQRLRRCAELLLPWVYHQDHAMYVVVPVSQPTERARTAAHCLVDDGMAHVLNSSASFALVARSEGLAHRVLMRQPNAREQRFEVFRVTPAAARAMRLHYLEPEAKENA